MIRTALRFRPGILLGCTALIALLMMTLVLLPQLASRHARLEVLRGHVGEVARVAASVVDGDLHRQLIESRTATSEERSAALAPLLKLHRAWPEAKYLYTMGERDGQAFFVLDTAQDASFAAERGLRASAYLEPFRLRAEYSSDWLDELAAGKTFVNPQYQMDDYGYFLTGHAPIRDAQGRVAGFVGVDFDLAYAMAEERRFHLIELTTIVGGLLLSLMLGYIYARHHFDQQEEVRQHRESSMNDSLTGLLNRRGAEAAIQAVTSGGGQAADARRCHAALLVDIDHFKAINDTRGHAEGDAVITRLANALRIGLDPVDVPARIGGDEFLIFLPDCNNARAEQVAERLLENVRREGDSSGSPFAVSIGVATALASEGNFDLLYHRADVALYDAKRAGKNRHALYRGEPAGLAI